jgi:hypothetical protein
MASLPCQISFYNRNKEIFQKRPLGFLIEVRKGASINLRFVLTYDPVKPVL